eukprot:5086718-Pyramimonas_sp.AAC.1
MGSPPPLRPDGLSGDLVSKALPQRDTVKPQPSRTYVCIRCGAFFLGPPGVFFPSFPREPRIESTSRIGAIELNRIGGKIDSH